MSTADEFLRQLDQKRAELLALGASAAPPGMQAAGMAGMASPMGGAAGVRPVGLLVSITVPTGNGEVPCYLQFGPEGAANPQAVIQALMQGGWPVKCYPPRQQNGWQGGGYGGGGRRGWGRYG